MVDMLCPACNSSEIKTVAKEGLGFAIYSAVFECSSCGKKFHRKGVSVATVFGYYLISASDVSEILPFDWNEI